MTMRPGGELATRPLHFIWMADCSGSMDVDGKIQSLNTAIKEAIPNMQTVADREKALSMVAEQLRIPPMVERALPPVLVLISDGQPTDDYASGLKALMD